MEIGCGGTRRYRASLADLAQRYGEGRFEIIGPPEIRDVGRDARYFNPGDWERRTDRVLEGKEFQGNDCPQRDA